MEINKQELSELLESTEGFVVVDFWAAWCGPCKMLANHFQRFSEDNPEIVMKKVEVDTEENDGIALDYQIKSIPTIIYFKNGVEVSRLTGAQNVKTLQMHLDAL